METANAWTYEVDEAAKTATIGNPLENAIWEEFGTGEYALNGDGRKDVPWFYVDYKGEGHWTKGKKPRRHLYKAMTAKKSQIKQSFTLRMKELNGQ